MDKILYFDCFSGISGDMTLGALLDLGLDVEKVRMELSKLGLSGFELTAGKMQKYGISGTDADVLLRSKRQHLRSMLGQPDSGRKESANETAEYCDALGGETGADPENHSHDHGHEEERSFEDIKIIINNSGISDFAKELSLAIFWEIARAEAEVHGKDIAEIHFHEVGAIDSIVDIVGVAICLEMLQIKRIICSTLHEGTGVVECRHGVLPVPVPAVAQMLQGSGITLSIDDINGELVTPTGLGILKTLIAGSGSTGNPEMIVEKVGYGFGKRDTGRLNALRVVLGRSDKTDEKISVIETNIDDMTGEMLGYVMEKLFETGALDVYYMPIQMKKNRPAVKLTVLCALVDTNKIAETILRETTTLGVRIMRADRITMNRSTDIADTEYGPIRFKHASYNDIQKTSPEYEDCAKAARTTGTPLKDIMKKI